MSSNWKRPAATLGLAAAILAMTAMPQVSMADTLNLDNPCSMTISAGSFEDLVNASVVLDVYKVADAAVVQDYDTYTFDLKDAYTIDSLKPIEEKTDITDEEWKTLANEAAKQTLTAGNSIAPVVQGAEAGTKIDVDAGLYLVVARSEDLENYYTTIKNEDGADTVVTFAQSDDYEYTYTPELVALPTKENLSTADRTDWIYDLTGASMKPSQAERYGNLIITKTLDDYLQTGDSGSGVTFVFSIQAVVRGDVVYDDVIGLTFDAAGTKTCEIMGKIPAGSQVTVTEVYGGQNYTALGTSVQTVTIPAPRDEMGNVQYAEAAFENTASSGDIVPGGGNEGIVNRFEYVEDANGNAVVQFDGNDTDNSTSQQ